MADLRVGVVGLGAIATAAHLPALERNPNVCVTAVADLSSERVSEAASRGVRATTDVDSVLGGDDVDAVVIATPPAATPELVARALAAGKHVLAEKPLAPTMAEAARVRDAPGAAERLQIGLTYRHHPAIDRLRAIVAEGLLGRPLYVQASLCDEPFEPTRNPQAHARRLRSLEHLPPVVSDGVHACDRINVILGSRPVSVTGWSVRTDATFAAPNINGGLLTYEDGTAVRLEVIWLTPVLPHNQFVITGPLGLARLDPPTFHLEVELADGTTETLEPPGAKAEVCFDLQLARFVESCRTGTPPVPGLDEALASLELAERIAAAAGASREVAA